MGNTRKDKKKYKGVEVPKCTRVKKLDGVVLCRHPERAYIIGRHIQSVNTCEMAPTEPAAPYPVGFKEVSYVC